MKTKLTAFLVALFSSVAVAQTNVVTLINATTTTTAVCSAALAVDMRSWNPLRVFMASGTTSAGAGAATVIVYGSTGGSAVWVELGTITLTLGTTITFGASTGGFATAAPWPYVCARVSAISGTGAAVTVSGGAQ